MKKAITLSFLLFAGIAILAHAVIPHHHHDKSTICLLAVQCEDSKHTHKHSRDSDCRQKDDSGRTEECPLKKAYLRPGNIRLSVDLNSDSDFQHPAPFLFSMDLNAETAGLKGLPFRQKPYLSSGYTSHISDSSGLRAPPTFV